MSIDCKLEEQHMQDKLQNYDFQMRSHSQNKNEELNRIK